MDIPSDKLRVNGKGHPLWNAGCLILCMAEKEVKIKVIEWLMKHEKHSVVIPEVTLGHKANMSGANVSRADIFAVNGDISIYEIKTERDTLDRLDNQLAMYQKVANRVSVVVADKFVEKAIQLPENIGVYSITSRSIKKIRPAKRCQITTDAYLQYWWGLELKEIFKGFSGWSKLDSESGKQKLINLLTDEQIRNLTLYRLKERYSNESKTIENAIIEKRYDDLFPKRNFGGNIKITPLKEMLLVNIIGVN
jgi:hypothetical protein